MIHYCYSELEKGYFLTIFIQFLIKEIKLIRF